MTTEYKLLLNDSCTFTPQEKKEEDSEDMKRFQIIIENPKNLMAYQVWNSDTPKANAGTSKIFGIAPSLLVECIYNYNKKVKNVDGFIYQPTAWCILGDIVDGGKNSGGILVLEQFFSEFSTDTPYVPLMKINAYTRTTPELEGLIPFPDKPFSGNIRMNINSLQSTSMLNVLENEFIEDWLKPTYNKLRPYPYTANLLEDGKTDPYDRNGPKVNYGYAGKVSIKNISSGVSRITVTNPLQSLLYFIWDPTNPFTNKNSLPKAELITLNLIYSYFQCYKKSVIDNGLPLNEYAWYPVASIDLIDENGKSVTYLGKIVNMISELGKPNESPTIMIDIDTRNFELYKNKQLSALPNGEYLMVMDIDGDVCCTTNPSYPCWDFCPNQAGCS